MTLDSEQLRTPLAASGASGLRPPDEGPRLTLVEDTYGDSHVLGGSAAQDGPHPADTAPEGSPITVLVVDRKGNFSGDIERAARLLPHAPIIVVEPHPTRLMEQVAIQVPDVVLAAPEEMTSTGLRRLTQLHRAAPKCLIALTQTQGGPVISMTDAAACGATEAIAYPATSIKLRNALTRILSAAESLRNERVVIREVITEVAVPAAEPAHPMAFAPPAATAKVYTVTSPTGGCGKTFFATNLAAYLAGATGGRVLLVDLDLQFGEVSLALGLRPQRTISELINEESLLEAFPEYVVAHSSGYQVLSAPADPFAAELVGPREATKVLEAARVLYDYVVVDTPPSLNEVVLAAFDQSRYLVVMATMDVPSLRNLKVFLETIDRLKLPAEDVSCVLNKAEPDNGINLDELLRVYPGGFAAVLPYAKEVSRSLNLGKPVLMVDPRADISQKILEAGSKLVPAAEVKNAGWMMKPAARSPLPFRRKHGGAPAASIAPGGPGYPGAEPAGQPGRGYQPGPAYQPAAMHPQAAAHAASGYEQATGHLPPAGHETPPARRDGAQGGLGYPASNQPAYPQQPAAFSPAPPHPDGPAYLPGPAYHSGPIHPARDANSPAPSPTGGDGARAAGELGRVGAEALRPVPGAAGPVAPSGMGLSATSPGRGAGMEQDHGQKRSWFSRLLSTFHRGGNGPGGGGTAAVAPVRFTAPWASPVTPARPEVNRSAPAGSPSTHPALPPALSDLASGKAPGATLIFKGSRGSAAAQVHQSHTSQGNDQTSSRWKESRR